MQARLFIVDSRPRHDALPVATCDLSRCGHQNARKCGAAQQVDRQGELRRVIGRVESAGQPREQPEKGCHLDHHESG